MRFVVALSVSVLPFGLCGRLPAVDFIRGDANADASADLSDAVFTLDFLFRGGPCPFCMEAANANADATVDISDPIYLLRGLFLGDPPPPAPYPDCGHPEGDPLMTCIFYPPCEEPPPDGGEDEEDTIDPDRDGLSDSFEKEVTNTDPRRYDTDRDGLCDGEEFHVETARKRSPQGRIP